MITLTTISKSFDEHHVLKDISLDFPSGTVTAVIGPNGSGKTTMMKSILGLVRPDAGRIEVDGTSAIGNAASRERMGYMAQIARYPENLTAQEVIDMVKGLRQIGTNGAMQVLVERFDLSPHLNKPMRTLSGGTRQKVGAVIAMMYEPTSLLLDEPTAGLDPVASERLKEEIARHRDAGATVLITSHILSEIQELADRVAYIHEGAVLYTGNVENLLDRTESDTLQRAIARMMGGAL